MDKMQGITQSANIQTQKEPEKIEKDKPASGSLKGRIIKLKESQDTENLHVGKLRVKAELKHNIKQGNVKQKKETFEKMGDRSVQDKLMQAELENVIPQNKVKDAKEKLADAASMTDKPVAQKPLVPPKLSRK